MVQERRFTGKRFSVEANERNISKIGFAFNESGCRVNFEDDRGAYTIPMGAGAWAFSETERRGPYLVARAKNHLTGLPPFKVACAYRWLEDGALELTLRYIESPHTEKLVCRISGDSLELEIATGVRPAVKVKGALAK